MARAGYRCEYCRVLAYLSAFDYHIEHIIGLQHGGVNTHNNLAYCCSNGFIWFLLLKIYLKPQKAVDFHRNHWLFRVYTEGVV